MGKASILSVKLGFQEIFIRAAQLAETLQASLQIGFVGEVPVQKCLLGSPSCSPQFFLNLSSATRNPS